MTPEERAHKAFGYAGSLIDGLEEQVRAAILEEREACARLCESDDPNVACSSINSAWDRAREACAAAIRMRP